MNVQVAVIVFAYMLGIIGMSIYVYIKFPSQKLEQYILADRKVGPTVTAFSAVSSGATGWMFTGWVGAGYALGVSALWYAFTLPLMQLLSYRFIAPKLRTHSENTGALTVEVAAADIKGDPYHLIKIMGAMTVIVLLTVYLGSQIVATGIVMQPALGISYIWAISLASIVVALYVILGGYRAVTWTDTLQGIIMLIAYVVTPILLVNHLGGWGSFIDAVGRAKPSLLSLTAGKGGYVAGMFVLGWFAIATGYFGFPPMVSRYLAIKDVRSLSPSLVVASLFETSRMVCPIFIGLAARVILPDIGNPEQSFAVIATKFYPGIIAGILMAAFLAAVMSSVDTYALLISSSVTHTIYQKIFRPDVSAEFLAKMARVVVIFIVIAGFFIGLYKIKSILYFMMFAFGTAGVIFAVPFIMGFYWKRATSWGILAGMLGGAIGCVSWLLWSPYYPLVREQLLGLSVGIVSLVIVSLLTQKSQKQ
jgi:sodium/proline symporter